ncbi:MAG TPA: carboxypeptidase regulatory-like domain-containing protein [bacterium]
MAPKRNLRFGVALAAIIASLSLIVPHEAAATGGISGRVTGPNGEPLAGVEVQAFLLLLRPWAPGMFLTIPDRRGLVAWTQTAADGSYELAGLPATLQYWCTHWGGHYYLLFSPPRGTGFPPRVLRGLRGQPSRMLLVEDGKTLTGFDVRLGPPASIGGTVTGPDGAPLADAWVGADIFTQRDSARVLRWRTTTDGLGRFVLTNLEDEPNYVKVDAPGPPVWAVFYPGGSEPVPIRPILGARSSGYDIAIPTPGMLQVNPPSGQDYTAWSFSTGFDELSWEYYWPSPTYLPPGDYRIGLGMSWRWSDNTYYPGTFQWDEASPVTVKSGELTSITLAPTAPGIANGTVVDSTGAPVDGVTVSLSEDELCGPAAVTQTGSDGVFTISSRDDRKIFFSKEGYAPVWFNDKVDRASADVVRFRSGETVSLPPVVLASLGAPGSIAGRVTTAGSPGAGARVEVWASPAGATALRTITPDADGNYVTGGLPPGAYVLRFLDTTPGSLFGDKWYPEAVSSQTATPVLVEPGLQIGNIDADLGAKGSISGTMTQDHQRLLIWAQACLTDALGNVLRCVYTSLDDTYSFEAVAPGSYLLALDAVQAYSWGRWYPNEASMATATPIVVAPGQALAGMDIDFPPLGRIEGQLSVSNGTQCGQMALVDGDADVVRRFAPGYRPGPFFFDVPPGRYRLLSTSVDTYYSPIYPQWYPGKTLASEAQVIEVLPGQTVSGIDVMLEDYGHNRPPSLTQPDDIAATEGMEFALTLAATDPEGDLLTFGAENLPSGATFDPYSGEFRWTPTCTQAGTYPAIRFAVTDHGRNNGSEALSAQVTVPVSVAARDCAPVLDPIGNRTVIVGETLTLHITASNPEGGALVLDATGLPPGATFNPADATFSWTPGATQRGVYTVTFAAVSTLDTSLRDEETVTISAVGPLLFSDDFEHLDGADPDWARLSGFWAVRDHTLRSSPLGIAIAVAGPTDFAGTHFLAGRIAAQVTLQPLASGTPNVALLFAYRDPQHYRYVRFYPSATEIGQVGMIDGQAPPLPRRLARALPVDLPQFVRIDVRPGGAVQVFAGGTPLGGLQFSAAVPGRVGVMTRNAQGVLDNFRLWARTVLN